MRVCASLPAKTLVGHAVGHALPLDRQPVVGPVQIPVPVQIGEQELSADGIDEAELNTKGLRIQTTIVRSAQSDAQN